MSVNLRIGISARLLVALSGLAMAGNAVAQDQAPAAVDATGDVVIAEQDLGPATGFPVAFSPAEIAEFNNGVREGILSKMREKTPNETGADLSVVTEIAELGASKTFRSKIEIPGRMFIYQYTGKTADKAHAVICVARSAKAFAIAGSACETRAASRFKS